MTAPKGQNLDGMPRSPGGGDPLLSVVAHHIALQERYQAKLAELAEAQTRVEDLIETLEPVERTLFRYRYIEGLTWEEVCVAIGYSWRQTHNIHGRALDKLLATEMVKEGFRPDIGIVDEWGTMPGVADAVHRAAVQYAVLGKTTKKVET